MNHQLRFACLALASTAMIAGRAWTQVGEPKPLVITAENLMAGDDRHKAIGARGGDAKALMPGDVVRYKLTFTNLRTDSVRNVQFNDPIPAGLRYVAGSAAADRKDVSIEFSIDAGKSWSEQPMIEEVIDGRKVQRPAPPESYTHVRWNVRGWLSPKSAITTEFKVQLSTGATKP